MIAPEVLQQFTYKYAFRAFIVSSFDDSIVYGRFDKKGRVQREL